MFEQDVSWLSQESGVSTNLQDLSFIIIIPSATFKFYKIFCYLVRSWY